MEFFADVASRVQSIRDLVGVVEDPAVLPAAVDHLNDAEVVTLLDLASGLGQLAERLRTAAAGVVAQRSRRAEGHSGLAQSRGHRNAVALVQQLARVSRAEAARQVRVGESLFDVPESSGASGVSGVPGVSGASGAPGVGEGIGGGDHAESADLGGQVDPSRGDSNGGAENPQRQPWHAPLMSALLTGTISATQHDAIARGLGEPPLGSDRASSAEHEAAWSLAAADLIREAERVTVEELAKSARSIRDLLDPVGAEQRYLARHEARSFRMWTDREGITRGSIVFDDLSAAWVRSAFDAAMRPRRGGPRFVDPAERAKAQDLMNDPRTNDQLAFDLFLDVMRAGTLADAETVFGVRQPGVRLVRILPEATASAAFTEDDTQVIPAWVASQQACTVGTLTVTTDHIGNPLNLGRRSRLYTSQQRVALAIRDGGCRWRDCDRPASYCEAHHIDSWSKDGGRTDIDRGILLCRFHHMQLHHGGWRITRNDLDDFVLHDPGGHQFALPRRLAQKYAWSGIAPPPKRFAAAAAGSVPSGVFPGESSAVAA
ncbi:DUF222 domain-containing protein [Leucobacter insecticola]|uniref:DUF222 domain-containing protein n=1 Tax=Leucobacter insecticola TaxID=2714934 RepID=A0A6G8FK81_9MICO|nr:HNH endonuclease signature motif containing protein [Leucobacter insecticola]QIM16880.1 DUF222 domain-containing protein [Leucobacter insecticola]